MMTQNSKHIFSGRIISLEIEQVRLPNGTEFKMEIVHHPGGSAVVAVDSEQNLCLIRQYRHICKDWIWELPAGKIDNNEEPRVTAERELLEEAGISADKWQSLGEIQSSPGIFTEIIHCYLATNLSLSNTQHEAEELIEVHWVPLHDAFNWAMENKITDAKTIVGICRACEYLKGRK